MGSMTRDEIITEGCLQAGVAPSQYTSRAVTWLKTWLKQQYRAWPWPFLLQSREGLSLPAGTTALAVGSGDGGISDEIARILSPLWVYDSSYGTRMKAPIISVNSTDDNEAVQNSATYRGLPSRFKIRTGRTSGGLVNFDLIPFPFPNRDYLLQFNYIGVPTNPASATSTVPLYPNDMTMISAIKVACLKDKNGDNDPQYQAALTDLSAMSVADRIRDGSVPGTNDLLTMDNSVFR